MRFAKLLCSAALALSFGAANAQEAIMDILNERFVKLSDGTDVHLYAKVNDPTTWYYLPAGFRLATRPDGAPHFLFLKYVTEQREDAGGASGAIFSAMFQYGLTNEQLAELQTKIGAVPYRVRFIGKVGRVHAGGGAPQENLEGMHGPLALDSFQKAKIVPAPITTEGPGSFQVTSAVLTDKTLTRNMICSGRAPTFPGEKMAIAANLGPIGAQLFVAPIEKKMASSDLKLEINYNYYVKSPAVEATLTIDMSKLDERTETINKHFQKLYKTERSYFCGVKTGQKDVPAGETYEESLEDIQVLKDMGVIKCHIDTTVDSDLAEKITEGFMQMFVTLLTQPMNSDKKSNAKDNDEQAAKEPEVDKGLDVSRINRTRHWKRQELYSRSFHFSAAVPIKKQGKMTADLLDMYDGVKNNPRCVASVLLNDPFFTHRDVKVVLDLDAKDIFDDAINYATINIRKRRASGSDFLDSVTIDSKFLKDNGTAATLTYARGEEKNPDAFEYQVQWSLRGGVLFPENPTWQVGQFQGVTVAPPIRPTSVDFQWDNEAMKEKDIVRIAAQINYWQFGKERTATIQPLPDQNLRPFRFFRDDGKQEYAYRLIYFHKSKGRLVGPWQRDSSGYIYASIPDDILDNADYGNRAKEVVDGAVEHILGGGA